MIAGAIAIALGLLLLSLSLPPLSNLSPVDMSFNGSFYSSPSIHFNSSDIMVVESPASFYLIPSASLQKVSRQDISSIQIQPSANDSVPGLTTKSWTGIEGNFTLVSFNSTSTKTGMSFIKSSSENSFFAYSIMAMMGFILFIIGIIMIFAGLILRKKRQRPVNGIQLPDQGVPPIN